MTSLALVLAVLAASADPAVPPRTVALLPAVPNAGVPAATQKQAAAVVTEELKAQGWEVIDAEKVAAACKAKKAKLPCGEDAACIGKAAAAAGAPFAAALVMSPAGKTLTVKLVVADAEGTAVANQTSLAVKPQPAPVGEALKKQVPRVTKKLDERLAKAAPAPEPAAVAAAKPAPAPAPEPARPAAAPAGNETPAELLAQAQKAYEAMEYEPALALATRLLAIPGLDTDTRLDAYVVQASCLAITADSMAAEAPFRLLLRARPDFDLPKNTSPKILGVFQKVQAEERVISEQVKAVGRKRLVEGLQLLNEPPVEGRGGRVLPFAFRLRDPTSAVSAFEVPFRKQGEASYSMLALKRDTEGAWKGTIPAEWTASDKGFVLEYYLLTRDEAGPLLTKGEPARPLLLNITAGAIERPKPVPRAAFWTGVALTAAAAVAAGSLAVATVGAQDDYNKYAARGTESPIDGAVLASKAANGRTLSQATIGTAIGAGVVAVVTAILLPFTKSADEEVTIR